MGILRHKRALLSLIVAFAGWLFWQFGPVQAIYAISTLSDPAKLATLGERGANARLNKIVYWLDQARQGWVSPETAISVAQWFNGSREPRASLVKTSLVRSLKLADELGLWTRDNRGHLRRGQAAVITRGPYRGETVEIDHIVPFSLAPEVGNELANLEMMPKSLNRQKSNHVNTRQLDHAERLFHAGLLKQESLARVKAQVR